MRIPLEEALARSAIAQGLTPSAASSTAASSAAASPAAASHLASDATLSVPGLSGQPNHAAFLSLAARSPTFEAGALVADQRSPRPSLARTVGPLGGPILVPTVRLPIFSRLARITGQEAAEAAIDALPQDLVREAVCWLSTTLGDGGQTLPEMRTAVPGHLLLPVQRGPARALRQETLLEQVLVALEQRGDVVTTLDGGLNTTEGPYRYHLRRVLAPENPPPPEDAFKSLAAWYICAFAPASARDLAAWSGLSEGQSRRALAGVPETLRAVEVDGVRGECFIREVALDAPVPDQPFCVVLPWTDTWLQAYRDQGRFLPSDLPGPIADRDLVLLTVGQGTPAGQAVSARLRVVGSAREPRFQPEPWRRMAAFEEEALQGALEFLSGFFDGAAPPTG